MGRRMSQQKRMSLAPNTIMAPVEDIPERGGVLREFIGNHIKTIVTIFMIFGTIAVIVLIVMVHKWRYESHQASIERACLDVAIVGAGISGSFAAWRMRHRDLKVHLFEMSNRIGGRIYTRHFDEGDPHVLTELGAMYYLPKQHKLLNWTIHALQLTPSEFLPPNPDQSMAYLRGTHLRQNQMNTSRKPYYLTQQEQQFLPEELKNFYLSRVTSNDSDVVHDPIQAKTKEGIHLYKHGYWNLLARVASQEGYNFLYDTAPFRSLLSNENAAVLGAVRLPSHTQGYMTVAEGMDAIPKRMIQDFLNASDRHDIHLNQRLACIHRDLHRYKLTFVPTRTSGGITKDDVLNDERLSICARNVVLAIPRKPIEEIQWNPIHLTYKIHQHLDSIQDVPAIRIVFIYNQTWWDPSRPPAKHVITDLPIRQVVYHGSQKVHNKSRKRRSTQKHVFMVASPDSTDTEYFTDLIAKYKNSKNCTEQMGMIHDINKQLSLVYNVSANRMPAPERVLIQEWAKTPSTSGWHIWKKNINFNKIKSKILQLHHEDRVYVVGSAYCGGQCQLWAEGGLQTVEELLNTYLYKGR